MNTAVISLGSNVADRDTLVRDAISRISSEHTVTAVSDIYEGQDEEYNSTPYSNAVMRIATPLDHAALNDLFKAMERDFGRTDKSKETRLVPLDIDIVIFNDEIVRPRDFARSYFSRGYSMI